MIDHMQECNEYDNIEENSKFELNVSDAPSLNQLKPTYDNELSMYSNELLKRIVEFQEARADFGETTDILKLQETKSIEEEVLHTDEYHGRCLLLRKIGFKTNRLRTHFKTLRPLKYYTLNREIFETSFDEVTEVEATEAEFSHMRRRRRILPQKKKYKEVQEAKKPPSTRILEKLKATKLITQKTLIPCKCDNGKEVTFIIKGVCLCDKPNLRNLTTCKGCGEYCRNQIDRVSHEPYAKDSIEIYQKRGIRRSIDRHMKAQEEDDDEVEERQKGVKFSEISEEESDTEEQEEDERQWTWHKYDKNVGPDEQIKKKTEAEIVKPVKSGNDGPKEDDSYSMMNDDEEDDESSEKEDRKIRHATRDTVKKEAGKSPSLILLYKNQTKKQKSRMALTRELRRILDFKKI